MRKKNQGFTLVELLVTIAVGALVTLAATTVILMGLRLNRHSMGTASRHNTARILLTAMEDLATDGSINKIEHDAEAWAIFGVENAQDPIYAYDPVRQTVFAGDSVLLEGVIQSFLSIDSNDVLNIYVKTEDGEYNSAVFCRILPKEQYDEVPADKVEDIVNGTPGKENESEELFTITARKAFVNKLLTQYYMNVDYDGGTGKIPNYGLILDEDGKVWVKDDRDHGMYYSEWYVTSNGTNTSGKNLWEAGVWNPDTPWCACFVTWGIAQVVDTDINYTNYVAPDDDKNTPDRPSFAGVDSFKEFFTKDNVDSDSWYNGKFWNNKAKDPNPGDIIFIDWVVNLERNPQHVGVVLGIADEEVKDEDGNVIDKITYVYTIEGNVSGTVFESEVGIRKYKLDDPRILGYGILDWKTDDQLPEEENTDIQS